MAKLLKRFPAPAALALSLWLAAAPGLAGGVKPEITYQYFPVNYTRGIDVVAMTLRDSPLVSDGTPSLGRCSWRIKYDRRSVLAATNTIGVCRIQSPRVACQCIITLPQLVGGEGDPELRAKFAARLEQTRRHELEHCNIAVGHANELQQKLDKLREGKCDDLRETVRREFLQTQDSCSVDQQRFDHSEYRYSYYLDSQGRKRMLDAGFNYVMPEEGGSRPRLNRKPIHKNLKTMPPDGTEDLAEKGIYKDENGVWRNY